MPGAGSNRPGSSQDRPTVGGCSTRGSSWSRWSSRQRQLQQDKDVSWQGMRNPTASPERTEPEDPKNADVCEHEASLEEDEVWSTNGKN